MNPRVLRTVAEVRALTDETRRAGKRIACVPTMGYLHEGHLSLMREGKKRAPVVIVTLFVNPLQFGPQEDLTRYPRDFEGDLAKCGSAGVEALFAPDVKELYPEGFQTQVEVTQVSQGLDGEKRPGHFKGVATVVTKLLCIVRPDVALFGEKDYQQLQVIRALERDLNLGIEIVGMPTVREPDGLAMSSRNSYLSPDERKQALALSRGLFAAQGRFRQGERGGGALVEAVRSQLNAAQVREDYVALVDATTLKPLGQIAPGQRARLLVAGYVGKTRLIDNVAIE